MMFNMPLKDVTGQKFGLLTAIERRPNRGPNTIWAFRCDCGGFIETYIAAAKCGRTKSCGCLLIASQNRGHVTHGLTRRNQHVPEYASWAAAKGRCTNPHNAAFADYGGRGIKMCAEWLNDFGTFYRDMGPRPPKTSLDRIDNGAGYQPGNCRWATRSEQAANKRNNVLVTHEGRTMILREFADLMGVGYTRLSGRMIQKRETAHEAAEAMRRRM